MPEGTPVRLSGARSAGGGREKPATARWASGGRAVHHQVPQKFRITAGPWPSAPSRITRMSPPICARVNLTGKEYAKLQELSRGHQGGLIGWPRRIRAGERSAR